MILIGIALVGIGFIVLYIRIYQRNAIQGAVSETSPIFLIMFGLMDWKNNKYSILFIFAGLVLLGVSLFI